MDLRRKLFSGAILNGVSFAVSSSIVLSWYFITAKFLYWSICKNSSSIAFAGILNIADFGYGTFLYKISSELRQKAYENHIIRLWIVRYIKSACYSRVFLSTCNIHSCYLSWLRFHTYWCFICCVFRIDQWGNGIDSFVSQGRLLFKSMGKLLSVIRFSSIYPVWYVLFIFLIFCFVWQHPVRSCRYGFYAKNTLLHTRP